MIPDIQLLSVSCSVVLHLKSSGTIDPLSFAFSTDTQSKFASVVLDVLLCQKKKVFPQQGVIDLPSRQINDILPVQHDKAIKRH